MGCLVVLLTLISPRLALIVLWIFTNLVDRAFESFILPLLGLFFLPWTTLFYVLAWSPVGGVGGIGWVFVGFGAFFDVSSYAAGSRRG